MTRFAEAALAAGRAACGVLGWTANEFWQATPAELALALSAISEPGAESASPLTGAELQDLERGNG